MSGSVVEESNTDEVGRSITLVYETPIGTEEIKTVRCT